MDLKLEEQKMEVNKPKTKNLQVLVRDKETGVSASFTVYNTQLMHPNELRDLIKNLLVKRK